MSQLKVPILNKKHFLLPMGMEFKAHKEHFFAYLIVLPILFLFLKKGIHINKIQQNKSNKNIN